MPVSVLAGDDDAGLVGVLAGRHGGIEIVALGIISCIWPGPIGCWMGTSSANAIPATAAPSMAPHPEGMMSTHSGMHAGTMTPTMPGQDAFGAIQEIVRLLETDPKTDWSKVDLEALRQHLIDMNEVMLKADAAAKPIEGGLEIAVTGSGRTLLAIQRMIPAHAQTVNGLNGWNDPKNALDRQTDMRIREPVAELLDHLSVPEPTG